MDAKKQAEEPRSEHGTKYRTHTCDQLRLEDVKRPGEVKLAGYVHEKRGDDAFYIRDCYGKTLVTAAAGAPKDVLERFRKLNPEDVVQVAGKVAPRAGPREADLPTGEIAVEAAKLELLCAAQPVPEELGHAEVSYEDRLIYRQLYLRRPEMQSRLALRHRAVRAIRDFLESRRFLEMETPQLFWYDKVAVIPEPVPIGGGKAFALPSGPVVLDQYLKAPCFDRSYQFLRVTRRESEPTPMHAQEHTSLDINMSYVDAPDMFAMVERMLAHVWKAVFDAELVTPFPRFSFEQAMARYGTDRIDARFGLEWTDLPAAGPNGRGVRVPGGAKLTDDDLEALEKAARETKPRWAKAPAAVTFARFHARKDPKATRSHVEGTAARLLDAKPELLKELGAETGDAVLLVTAEAPETARAAAASARASVAKALGLVPEGKHAFAWVHSYPYLQKDVRGNYTPSTVVFAGPHDEDQELIAMMKEHPEKKPLARSKAFDLVLNGVEVATGYIGTTLGFLRCIWDNMFDIGSADLVRLRAPIESQRFGCPPHGGLNFGLDRLIALMAGASSLDDVMIFPKDRECRDRLLEAPGPLPPEAAARLVEAPVAAPHMTDLDLSEEVIKL